MIAVDELARVFVEVTQELVGEYDPVEFIASLTDRTATLTGTEAVGVVLADRRGELHYMGSSSEGAHLLELLQLQQQEGPCLDAYGSGEMVVEQDLEKATVRWPTFAPRALELGVHSMVAIPMRMHDSVIGAMNLFGGEKPLDKEDAALVQSLADLATVGLMQARNLAEAEVRASQLQTALDKRVVIEQAKGAVATTFGTDVQQAFELMRGHARSKRMQLTELAHMIVTVPSFANELRKVD